ncbi:dNA mismatch repair protein MutL [Clostridium sp. CAG:356]|nr:dNA mismatch repair protein MutL [Clostridium sp. CAG:356]
MGNIVLLDDLTINKIAAGEVIERPANVVKELVENSIDAGATKIVVEVKNGGKTLVKIVDNGKGISANDIPLSLERHATSKIRRIEDLEHTYSMGFRGEALASIASISELTMLTRTAEENGTKIIAEAGEIIKVDEIGLPVGTTIMVEKLFFNTPVRYKFLKNDATEFRYIKEWVQKTALVNSNIAFKLINDGKTVFQTNGNGNIRDIIYLLYGKEIEKNLLEVNYENEGIKVTGVIGNTTIARDNRKSQILYLNKRNIKNQILTNSADQAFKGATGIGKYGFFILNLEMPANYYDVNVHPTKIEVRFNDEDKLYKVFYHAIKSAMLNSEFLDNNEKEQKKENYIENELEFLTNKFQNEAPVELINRENKREIEYKYIGILFRTFIVIEIGNDMFLIDQHAGHERILYEQIKENYKNHIQNNSQLMLIPEVFNLSHKEIEFVKENIELFRNTGFDIELFGEDSVKISGIPDIEYKVNKNRMFLDVLDEMITTERTAIKDVEERFIATVACKAAVKANMDLTRQEVDNLIQRLLKLKNPFTCPHGRPTTIKFSKDELFKNLK